MTRLPIVSVKLQSAVPWPGPPVKSIWYSVPGHILTVWPTCTVSACRNSHCLPVSPAGHAPTVFVEPSVPTPVGEAGEVAIVHAIDRDTHLGILRRVIASPQVAVATLADIAARAAVAGVCQEVDAQVSAAIAVALARSARSNGSIDGHSSHNHSQLSLSLPRGDHTGDFDRRGRDSERSRRVMSEGTHTRSAPLFAVLKASAPPN